MPDLSPKSVMDASGGLARIGTCSWKYDSWKGLVYDEGKEYGPDDYLPDYARHFSTVEVDQWFWGLFPGGIKMPDPETARAYAESVPDDFIFSVKAPNSITLTHYYNRQPKKHADFAGRPNRHFLDNGLFERFLESIEPLHKKLGPVMFQFEYLNKSKMESAEAFMDIFGEFMSAAPPGFDYAVETRNKNYLSPRYMDWLAEIGAGMVWLDGYHMPGLAEAREKLGPGRARFGVVRLHGGDREGIEKKTGKKWDRIVARRDAGIEEAARMVRDGMQGNRPIFVNINNHYEGSAPLTAERLVERLKPLMP